MLEILAAAIAAYGAWKAASACKERRWRSAATIVLVTVTVAAVALIPYWRRITLERRLAEAAGAITGEPVDVDCVTLLGEFTNEHYTHAGWVNWDENLTVEKRTVLSHDTCQQLRTFLADPATGDINALYAVHTLAHEAQHMAGTTNEAETECETHQRMVAMAQQLGATRQQAEIAAVRVWTETYPLMPPDYRSGECRDGGALDENLPDAPWDLAPRS